MNLKGKKKLKYFLQSNLHVEDILFILRMYLWTSVCYKHLIDRMNFSPIIEKHWRYESSS